jgi:fluoride exporter
MTNSSKLMQSYLLVFLGAGLGGALRHAVNVGAERAFGPAFPWGTLAVNVAGSFAMGMLAGWLALKAGEAWTQPVRLFVATGLLGGFTTFSAFSLDAVVLWERGAAGAAFAYGLASVALSIGGLVAGLFVVRVLTS